jgi:FKBP-type peptidyl-prolyl cis-trans isomerase (trigger factor)
MFRRPAATPPAKADLPAAPRKGQAGTPVRVVITDTAPCQKALRVEVGPPVIAPVRDAVVKELQKDAALDGFRKGHAPVGLIEQRYGKAIHDETLHRVTKQVLAQAVEAHQLKPVGPFELTRSDFQEPGGLTLEATVEVEPSFALATYRGLAAVRPSANVTPPELDEALRSLQESMAKLVPTGEGEAKARQVPALDNELAKDLGYETLERLRQHVEAKLREQKRAAQAQAVEAGLCGVLLERHAFEVPPRLVEHQTERLTREFLTRLLLGGMAEDEAKTRAQAYAQQLRTSAARQVKLGFILDRIAEAEHVDVSQEDVVRRLWQLAQRWRKDPAQVRRVFDDQGLWPSVVTAIRQEKTMALITSAAVIEDAAAPAVTPGAGSQTAAVKQQEGA